VRAYVIRNGKLQPEWSDTRRRTLSVGSRAISALIQTQGISDVQRIYETARHDGVDFNLAYIGSDFSPPRHAQFDTAYMKRLFDYAYRASVKGYPWHKLPPSEPSPDGD